MCTLTNCSEPYLPVYRRGSLFKHADQFGKIPAIGAAIGAVRTAGSILGMLGSGFVYGGAYFLKNETLKKSCLFAHERAIDETIRGIYEILGYGVFCENLARKIISKVSSRVSSEGTIHNYFAHGSQFTVDANGRIRYYSIKETSQLTPVAKKAPANAPKPTAPQITSALLDSMPLKNIDCTGKVKQTTHLVHLSKTQKEKEKFIATLLKDLEKIRAQRGKSPDVDISCYF